MFYERWYYYLAFFIILVVADRLLRIFSNSILGWIAEKKVARTLIKLNPEKYKVINNLMIEAGGKTAQIDHLVISNYGIFVIETKNYYGWLAGSDYGAWTLTIYRLKRKIGNPIIQNNIHVNVLKNLLSNYPEIPFKPIVVFTKRSILTINTKSDIVYISDLLATIKKHHEEIISDDLKEKIFEMLIKINIRDRKIRKEHVAKIKKREKDNNDKVANNICPRCGGNLVNRQSKYGKFKGCSNFPDCKFTVNIYSG